MYWRRIAELPGWLKAVMLGQLVNSAGALAWIYLTLYLVEDRGMSAQQAGFAAGAYGVGLLGGNLCGGWFGDRFGLRSAAVVSQLAWVVTCLAMPIVPTPGLAWLAALAGLCGGASRPNLSALVATALPAERRRALVLRFVNEMSTREISEVLGRSEGATRVLIHRSLQAVARQLGRPHRRSQVSQTGRTAN